MTVAFYLRLSLADGDLGKDNKDESNSIEHQRDLLKDYVSSHAELQGEIREYVDDGYTGTNFRRPGFAQMIEDAKAGLLQVILVKDLSRLGRDYIGVGDYLEQIFPMIGVRFIAVTSGYDSAQYLGKTIGLDVSIHNLINHMYSRDISKKMRSSLHTKWRKGSTTTGRPPFGYVKDPKDRGKWLIDEEAAAYVRLIFTLALKNWSTIMIVSHLNDLKVPTPAQYSVQHGHGMYWVQKVDEKEVFWTTGMVVRILRRYEYTGAFVNGFRTRIDVGSRVTRKCKPSEQFITENAHPAIVTREEYEKAQEIIRKISSHNVFYTDPYPLKGKLRCGNCHLSMAQHEDTYSFIYCAHKKAVGRHSACTGEYIPMKVVEGAVWYAIHNQLMILSSSVRQKEERQKPESTLREQKKLEQQMLQLREEKMQLYERYAEGRLSRELYMKKKNELSKKIDGLSDRIEKLHAAVEDVTTLTSAEIEEYAEKYDNVEKEHRLSREMVEAFIDTVYVYSKDRIEIVFNGEDEIAKTAQLSIHANPNGKT